MEDVLLAVNGENAVFHDALPVSGLDSTRYIEEGEREGKGRLTTCS